MEPTRIPISELLFSQVGTTTEINVNLPDLPDSEVAVDPEQTIDFEGMKIEDGVCFYSHGQSLKVTYTCSRCLKQIAGELPLRPLEKQFYLKIPEDVESDLVQQIDKKHFEIDLTPLIQETVYLSVPTVLTCGEDCPGMPEFKGTLGKTDTKILPENPFAQLKEQIK